MPASTPAPAAPAMAGSGELLEIRELHVGYGWDAAHITPIVRGVSLSVGQGQVVGVAGESGCGKTTLALAAARMLDLPGRVTGGEILFQGRDLSRMSGSQLREIHLAQIAMVFQASMNVFNPVARLRSQFVDGMKAHGVSEAQAVATAKDMFDRVKLPRRFLDAYPHQLSGGMRQRAVIALCLSLRPRLLFLDEPTTALDVVVQRSILQMLNELRADLGFGVVFITHDLSLLVEIADKIAIMYAGEIVEEAPAKQLYEHPAHPYTSALMNAFPPVGATRTRMEGLPGQPPDLRMLPPGCPFSPRCPKMIAGTCDHVPPPEVRLGEAHRALCHLFSEREARVG
ncbi:MAG TPA: ABC transporter ATP-binding protein [Acidimicrobiales bacterium]|nr:ABC transporter ATP-binding protein [Acidimicrobiales bacterium]